MTTQNPRVQRTKHHSIRIADHIRALRTQRGWTCDDLANLMPQGYTTYVVRELEAGRSGHLSRRNLTVDDLFMFAEAFHVEPQRLLLAGLPGHELSDELTELPATSHSRQSAVDVAAVRRLVDDLSRQLRQGGA